MDLHVTLAAGPGVRLSEDRSTEEIVITHAHRVNGEQLHEELTKRTGARQFLVEGTPVGELHPGVPPLTSGAVIVSGTDVHLPASTARPSNLFFLVRSGPDAGKAVPLSRGTYTIGRSAADITINDPELSRVHCVLTVTDSALFLHDRNSANGVWVNGFRVESVPVTTDSDIRIGSSPCALVLTDAPAELPLPIDLSEPCIISAQPPPESSRLFVLTAFLPLVLGVVLAVTTGMWFFLAFSALSAVTGLVPLLSGRKKRRAFDVAVATAVTRDSERRRRAAPEAGRLTLLALQPRLSDRKQPSSSFSDGKYLRLGIADQPARVEAKPNPAEWRPPIIREAPVLVPLIEQGGKEPVDLEIRGPEQTLIQVAHLLLLQLSTLQDAGRILCYGPAQKLPPAARFLPRVTLSANRVCLAELLATGQYSTVVLLGTATLTADPALRVYRFSSSPGPDDGKWSVNYFPPEPVLNTPDGPIYFQPDLVRKETFDALARAKGALTRSPAEDAAGRSVPEVVSVPELITCDSASIAKRWRTSTDYAHLKASIGSSASGPLILDLVADGPHILVAGTTGSGKSEFLRTLVLGLALNYSPADLNLLLIDFKGGSGLGNLARLPQVSGLLTDLSAAAVSRALISLSAEVKRREAIFADAGAADYLEYRDRALSQLPRLVTVIDEFRMLSDDIPGAVHELMRIATLGRSLGMHLVLATQRPQGAVTSDIRANITASVALRMQSAMESQDVIESAIASSIPVEFPGRGYLRVASGPPIEFQTATTAQRTGSPATTITSFASYLTQESRADTSGKSAEDGTERGPSDATDRVRVLVASANTAAQAVPLPPLFEPVRPPLPTSLTRTTTVPANTPQLGLLDIPHLQEQRALTWDPARESHLALVGQPGSGLHTVLAYISAEHLRTLPNRHLYLLDGDSSVRAIMDAPQVGAYVTTTEIKRAARVLQRLAEVVVDRLHGVEESSAADPVITVIITGWARWATALRSGRFAWAEDALQEIVRDGEAAGIALVIAGERELIAARFYSMIPNRLYLPLGVSPEALLSWPKLPAVDAIPGRAFVQGRISAVADSVAQLITQPGPVPSVQPEQPPFTVAALPRVVSSSRLKPAAPGERTIRIPIGVGGDDLAPVHLELPQRSAALVVGAAGTGKSQALDLIAHLAPSSVRIVRPATDEDPRLFWEQAATRGTSANDLLLVDDADLLSRETHQHFAALLATGARAVFACIPSPSVATSPVLSALRVNPLGVILGPRSPTDGEVFGLRLEVDGTPPPGRGILVDSRRSVDIQLAQCDGAAAAGGLC